MSKPIRKPQPTQPIYPDSHGTMRFQENAIVRHLLDHGGIDMNKIACLSFPAEDRIQFAQLIGYSLSGFGELSYVSDEAYDAAVAASKGETDDVGVRLRHHQELRNSLRKALAEPMGLLYGKHPSDFDEDYDEDDEEYQPQTAASTLASTGLSDSIMDAVLERNRLREEVASLRAELAEKSAT